MGFWTFNRISPAAPSDPTVDLDTQLNDNWDVAEVQMSQLIQNPMPNTILNSETGQEWIYNGRLAVWDGTQLVFPADIEAAWSAWQVIALTSPTSARTLFTPKWRYNSLIKQVELSGCVVYSSASVWPASFTIFSDETEASGIPMAYQPNGGITFVPAATSIPSVANTGAGALIAIDVPTTGPSCRLRARFMGGSGGGNFVALDGVRWYY